jgi:hypothetical protein
MKKSNTNGDGQRVERTVRDGRVVDTIYDADGRVVEVVTWLKGQEPAEPGDPRDRGPMANRDGRPL